MAAGLSQADAIECAQRQLDHDKALAAQQSAADDAAAKADADAAAADATAAKAAAKAAAKRAARDGESAAAPV
jgi:hypothetical protein